jgi:gamma-glutamylputrescine oxidase
VRRDALLPPAEDGARCDVAIVGGGLAGLSAALELAQRGFSVRLLEASRLGGGASGRNGGQVILGLACEIDVIESQLGLTAARQVFDMTREAVALLRQHVEQHAPDAHWRPGFLSVAGTARQGETLRRWADRMRRLHGQVLSDIPPSELRGWIDSPRFHSAVHDPVSGHVNPLRLALSVAAAAQAAGARLHENSPVTAMAPAQAGTRWALHTPGGVVHAEHVLLAGNVALGAWMRPQGRSGAWMRPQGGSGAPPTTDPDTAAALARLAVRIMPVGTYVACTEPLDASVWQRLLPGRSAVCTTDFVLDYFRPTEDHRLLFGGGVSYSTRSPADIGALLRRQIARTFPELATTPLTHAWGGFVDITMNRAPDFGRLGERLPRSAQTAPAAPSQADPLERVYHLQGFSGHGVALTLLGGRLVAEAIAGDAGRLDVFSRLRHRPFPGGAALRTPLLVLGMAWYRLRDLLG